MAMALAMAMAVAMVVACNWGLQLGLRDADPRVPRLERADAAARPLVGCPRTKHTQPTLYQSLHAPLRCFVFPSGCPFSPSPLVCDQTRRQHHKAPAAAFRLPSTHPYTSRPHTGRAITHTRSRHHATNIRRPPSPAPCCTNPVRAALEPISKPTWPRPKVIRSRICLAAGRVGNTPIRELD